MNNSNFSSTVDTTIKLILLMLLIAWCLIILMPFVSPVIWGIIIAISLSPLHRRLSKKLGDRKKLSAILITVALLAIILVPSGLFTGSMIEGADDLGAMISNKEISIPPPNEGIKEWPVIGNIAYDTWDMASSNLQGLLTKYSEQIANAGSWLFSKLLGTGMGIILLLFSIVISGVLLINAEAAQKLANDFSDKIIGEKGEEFSNMAEQTVRNVTKGILGVALIQAFAAGLGFVLAGVPYAGLWAILCLFLAIIQVGPGLVIIPVIIYLYSSMGGLPATLWTVYFVIVMLGDNVLKPMLLGKGAPVPMLVIFLGAIGGFISTGFLGLFTGAVVLSLGYKLFISWLGASEENKKATSN